MDDIEETLPRNAGLPLARTASPADWLFVVFCCDEPTAAVSRHCLDAVHQVSIGRGAWGATRDRTRGQERLDLRIADARASSAHCELARIPEGFVVRDVGSRNGLFVNGERVAEARLSDGDFIEVGHTFLVYRAQQLPRPAQTDQRTHEGAAPLGTQHLPLEAELQRAMQLAKSELSILIWGESGTGKEVLARGLASGSGRRGPFVGVNCAALPSNLVESELFGHAKGAFSGADAAHPGLVRSAHHGTLFLDEVGDLPAAAQASLLRTLQEREVRPVGSTKSIPVDIRVLSATHRRLADMVLGGTFRGDLLARLAGYQLRLTPLRERREDMGLLVRRLWTRSQLRIDPLAFRELMRRTWPGNVRELQNCLHAASVLAGEQTLQLDHLGEPVAPLPVSPGGQELRKAAGASADIQKGELEKLLQEYAGNISAIARHVGKGRTQVQRWLKRFALHANDYRSAPSSSEAGRKSTRTTSSGSGRGRPPASMQASKICPSSSKSDGSPESS